MNKLYAILVFTLLFTLLFSFTGCTAGPETTTVTSTVNAPNQTVTSTSTVTVPPQTTTVTEFQTVTTTLSETITTESTSNTTTTSQTTTETRTELTGVEVVFQYGGMAEWDFVISNIVLSATSTEVFVKLNVNSMYQKSAFITVKFYDADEVLLGTSQTVEVRITQAGTVKTTEILFSIANPSSVSKIILVVNDE